MLGELDGEIIERVIKELLEAEMIERKR